jgi:hypothetical protein
MRKLPEVPVEAAVHTEEDIPFMVWIYFLIILNSRFALRRCGFSKFYYI